MKKHTELSEEEIINYRENVLPTLQTWEKAIINCGKGLDIPCNNDCNHYYPMHSGFYCYYKKLTPKG